MRCQILGGYVYYGEERRGERESQKAGRLEDGTAPDKSISLRVEQDETLKNIDFRFASFKKGTWRNYTCLDGLSYIEILAIYRDPDGVMWFGTNGGGVSRYDGRGFVNFTTRDGLASNRVHAIYCDPEGVMWFGTEGGVSRYDGMGMGDCPTNSSRGMGDCLTNSSRGMNDIHLGGFMGLSRKSPKRAEDW